MSTEMTTQRELELEAEIVRLRKALRKSREALQFANDSPGGGISDTIWMMHDPETLFDFMDEALSSPASTAALNELIEKVEKRTIERCAEKLLSIGALGDGDFLAAIRTLPTGQIKLEELL